MTTITIDVPDNQKAEYKKIFSSFVRDYSLDKLKEIGNKQFYLSMLDGVFDENEKFNEIKRKDGKLDFSDLMA